MEPELPASPAPESTLRLTAGGLTVEARGSHEYVSAVFQELKPGIVSLLQAVPRESLLAPTEAPAEGAEPSAVVGQLGLVEFYQKCKPSSQHGRVTVFAYYRKQYAATPVLDASDAERMYNEVGEKLPNAGAALSNAARKDRGWLKRLGKGRYEISSAGENWVKTTFSVQ